MLHAAYQEARPLHSSPPRNALSSSQNAPNGHRHAHLVDLGSHGHIQMQYRSDGNEILSRVLHHLCVTNIGELIPSPTCVTSYGVPTLLGRLDTGCVWHEDVVVHACLCNAFSTTCSVHVYIYAYTYDMCTCAYTYLCTTGGSMRVWCEGSKWLLWSLAYVSKPFATTSKHV